MRDEVRALGELRRELSSDGSQGERIQRAADIIRKAGGYRWVGFYNVEVAAIAIVGWSGPGEPAFPRFPVSQGLCGEAVRSRRTVVVGDVGKDPSYLTTFGNTRSEIVVPILDPKTGQAAAILDVESERENAFNAKDQAFLERCAAEIAAAKALGLKR